MDDDPGGGLNFLRGPSEVLFWDEYDGILDGEVGEGLRVDRTGTVGEGERVT